MEQPIKRVYNKEYTKEVTLLSAKFTEILNQWLTKKELNEIRKRNKQPDYETCCATHDFCDPNEAMAEAWVTVFGKEGDWRKDRTMNIINKAWVMSKQKEFRVTV